MMRITRSAVMAMFAMMAAHSAFAQDASRLGKDLTEWGAERAGNKDGSIPAYDGGLSKPPSSYKQGSGIYVDPFASEKPLYTVTASNMAQYADKLAEGQKALLKKYPDYRLDVYPTHRTAAYPKYWLDASIKNAGTSKLTNGGVGIEGAKVGLPFPIPKTGHEVMWNHLLAYQFPVTDHRSKAFYVDQAGRATLTGTADWHIEGRYSDPENKDDPFYLRMLCQLKAPGTLAGQNLIVMDSFQNGRTGYQYIPSQRRAKLAPELSYDTPHPASAGSSTFDDGFVFAGPLDRFSFKLVGKKEMLLPYNTYKLQLEPELSKAGTAKFLNPDLVRWELHRVWVVEAELLPGKRHIYQKRTFYWDEDGFAAGMSDQYDGAGKLFRHSYSLPMQLYDVPGMFAQPYNEYDFSSNVYVFTFLMLNSPIKTDGRKLGPSSWTAAALEGRGVR